MASAQGFVQEPGRPHCLRAKAPAGPPATKDQAHGRQESDLPWERIEGRRRGTAERRQRSEAGRAMGSRSAPIVPRKRGNRPEGPRGGKRSTGGTELLEGKTTKTPISDTV